MPSAGVERRTHRWVFTGVFVAQKQRKVGWRWRHPFRKLLRPLGQCPLLRTTIPSMLFGKPGAEPECRPSNRSWLVSDTVPEFGQVNQLEFGRQRKNRDAEPR